MDEGVGMDLIKENVSIKLHTIIDDQGEKEMSVIKQKGLYHRKGQLEVLTFTDKVEDIGEIKNHISITPEKVTVKRSGAVTMNQQFVEGKKSECLYRHPYGMFHMELQTHHISSEYFPDQSNTEIVIEYNATINQQEPRSHHLTLTITEEK